MIKAVAVIIVLVAIVGLSNSVEVFIQKILIRYVCLYLALILCVVIISHVV